MSDPKPITCDEALRLLAVFLDGELHADDREGVQRHLEICRSCFSRAEFERRLKGEITRLGREEVSPGFEDRVHRLLGSFATLSTAEPADGSQA
jgi:anti-sigma factor (TIGR02949 family)